MLEPDLVRRALDHMLERVAGTLDACGSAFPYSAAPASGAWTTTPDGDWSGGYWIALLWIAHTLTGEARFAEAALRSTDTMEIHWGRDDMFRGLMFYLAGTRSWQIARLDRQRELGRRAARVMVSMYRDDIRAIPIGTEVRVRKSRLRVETSTAVDNVFICLLPVWNAWAEEGRARYLEVARAQLDTTLRWLVREDGFTHQIAEWAEGPDRPPRCFSYQSSRGDTCWSRGQAWAIAGYCLAYEHLRERLWLDVARRVLGHFFAHSSEDGVPGFDLDLPPPPATPRDTSAAAIVALALTRLLDRGILAPHEQEELAACRDRLVRTLVTTYLTPTHAGDARPRGMLLEGCFNFRDGVDVNNELIWGDYYLVETLWRLERRSRGAVPAW